MTLTSQESTEDGERVVYLNKHLFFVHQFLKYFGVDCYYNKKAVKVTKICILRWLFNKLLIVVYFGVISALIMKMLNIRLTPKFLDFMGYISHQGPNESVNMHSLVMSCWYSLGTFILIFFQSGKHTQSLRTLNKHWLCYRNSFDDTRHIDEQMEKKKFLIMAVIIICMAFFFTGMAFEISYYYLNPPQDPDAGHCHWYTIFIYYSLLMNATFLMFSSMAEFHMTCSFMQICFNCVNSKINKMVAELHVPDLTRVKAIRKCHNNCIQMVNRANDFWKYYLFIMYLIFVPMTVFMGYAILYEIDQFFGRVAAINWLITNSIVMIVMSLNASLIHSLAYKPYNDLYGMTVTKSSDEINYEVNLFLNRLNYDNVGFTCWNLLTITPNILLTVTTAVITYLLAVRKPDGDRRDCFISNSTGTFVLNSTQNCA